MVRTAVAAYLDVLCVLNLLSSDASLLSSSVARIKTPATFLPLPSLLEEISPSPLRVPISLPAATVVHISPVGDCRHRSLSDRGCQLVVCTYIFKAGIRAETRGRKREEKSSEET